MKAENLTNDYFRLLQLSNVDGHAVGLYIVLNPEDHPDPQEAFDEAFRLAEMAEQEGGEDLFEDKTVHDYADMKLYDQGIVRVYADEVTTETI